ncbi:MAG: EAL domain-containing protein [Gammaproteobacteria bacterium]|nr:EAL domain-containing protein [Gammaproteobacteria bacterium]
MGFFKELVNRSSIRYQLFIMVGIGILVMLLLLSVSSAWISNQKVKDILIHEGYEHTTYLALNSKLALLYSSVENVDTAIKATMSFTGVKALGIYSADYKLFTQDGESILPEIINTKDIEFTDKPVILFEDNASWHFVSEVRLNEQYNEMEDQLFKAASDKGKVLGYAYLVVDKSTLNSIQLQIVLINSSITILIAVILLIVIHVMIKRLTRPLKHISEVMQKTEIGEYATHVSTDGPWEIRYIADAYNRMISGIAERDNELRAHNLHLKKQAIHDHLTGLINRVGFDQALMLAIEESKSMHTHHVLCYLDLDKFKIVNDSCGHAAGDELLKSVSEIFRNNVRKDSDTLARVGGDEFAILLKNCSIKKAINITKKICSDVETFRFIWDKRQFSIGVSIGVIPLDENSGSLEDVSSKADDACYIAKERGRGRVHVIYQDDKAFHKRSSETKIANIILDYINNDKFNLHCQSIRMRSPGMGDAAFFEVLLRYPDIEGHALAPDVLIRASERYDLATQLDKWVVRNALLSLSKYPDVMDDIGLCHINITGSSLCNPDFSDYVIEQISLSGMSPEKLCFEITESSTIANMDSALLFIRKIHAFGCLVALDNFGDTDISFEYIRQLDIDFIKISSFFIRDINTDPVSHAMIRSINEICHILNIKTIAGSVETEEVMASLESLDIDYIQGFLIDNPVPILDYLESMRS